MGYKSWRSKDVSKEDSIVISLGNNKLGDIPSNSFPTSTCPPSAPCKYDGCYAELIERRWDHVRRTYEQNLKVYEQNKDEYWKQTYKFLDMYIPDYFRYFVTGDVPDANYVKRMIQCANYFPNTYFRWSSKHYNYLHAYFRIPKRFRPQNLIVLVSSWPNYPLSQELMKHRIAWTVDSREKRHLKRDYVMCKGSCMDCLKCYDPNETRDVVMIKHK